MPHVSTDQNADQIYPIYLRPWRLFLLSLAVSLLIYASIITIIRVVQGLRTSSPQRARVQANIAAAKLDTYWSQMRLTKSEVIGMSLVQDISSLML